MIAANTFFRMLSLLLLAAGILILFIFRTEPQSAYSPELVSSDEELAQHVPQRWSGEYGQITHYHFSFEFNYDPNQDYFTHLYIPFFEQRLDIRINSISVTASTDIVPWRGPLSAASSIVPIAPDILRSGINRIDLVISVGPIRFGSISRVYLGSESELTPFFRLRSFVEHDLKAVLFGVQSFLALACVILVLARRNEQRFFWFGLSMVSSCLFSIGVFSETFPAVVPLIPWATVLVSSAAIGFLGFAVSLTDARPSQSLRVAALVIPALGYILILSGLFPLVSVVLWFILPISIIFLTIAFALLLRIFLRSPSADLAFLVAGVLLMAGAVLHDQLLRLGFLEAGIMLALPARMLALFGIAIFLMLHLARITRELELASRNLAHRLRRREEELASLFEKERISAEKVAGQTERTRIMAELHDGVAGYLSTIVALSDVEQADRGEIQKMARHAIAELRLVIDALVMPEGDLRIALAALREQLFEPLKRLGITTEWSMVHLPEVQWLSPEQTLSVLRILQEAISNAVRHGIPRTIQISGQPVGSDRFAIKVVNTGGTPFNEGPSSRQLGLLSMTKRALALGGTTNLTPLPDGAEFILVLPLRTIKTTS
jgi:signal transduction histidine kinase